MGPVPLPLNPYKYTGEIKDKFLLLGALQRHLPESVRYKGGE